MEYKSWILYFLGEIGDSDSIFLSQIYTLMKRHVEKQGMAKMADKRDDRQQEYILWILKLALRNRIKAKEMYYLLSDFLQGSL